MASGGNRVRTRPNILITGTPGTGKTLTSSEVSERVGLRPVDVGKVAKEGNLYEGWDELYQCPILDEDKCPILHEDKVQYEGWDELYRCLIVDEDKVIDELEEILLEGGNAVEYHSSDLFPERWFDAVFVLRTNNTILYDRLQKRGYSGKKLTDNIQCEIFQTILEEAKESYSGGIVHELHSNVPEDLERNVDIICHFVQEWTPQS